MFRGQFGTRNCPVNEASMNLMILLGGLMHTHERASVAFEIDKRRKLGAMAIKGDVNLGQKKHTEVPETGVYIVPNSPPRRGGELNAG